MRSSFSFILLSLCFIAIIVMAFMSGISYWVWLVPAVTGMIATLLLLQSVLLPQRTVKRGMELITSQDYNNRLVKVGEPHSDKVVTLFNSLIDKLRAERLQNREQDSLLSLLIEASPMGVIMCDFDRHVALANKSFLSFFGISDFNELKGKKINEINNDLIPDMMKVPLGGNEIIRKGNFRIFRVYHLNFIQEGFKREFFLLESLTDEIMKAEKAAYEKVIRTISHEVNNTMGGVRSVLEIVAENSSDPDIINVVQSCDMRCETMGNFIREYAEVVKLPDPIFKAIELQDEIDRMLPFLNRMMPDKIHLIYNRKPEYFHINADVGLLQQVILNIMKNAVESILEEGYVKIDVGSSQTHVILTISNNGIPIDDTISSSLFTPFFTTKPNGKGIGLTLVRDVLNRHAAEYSLSTESDGITGFTIYFQKSDPSRYSD